MSLAEFIARDTDEIVPIASRVTTETARAIIIAFLAEQRATVGAALLPLNAIAVDGQARMVIAALTARAKAWEVRG